MTVEEGLRVLNFEKPLTFAKNLFLKDKKKGDLYLLVAVHVSSISPDPAGYEGRHEESGETSEDWFVEHPWR